MTTHKRKKVAKYRGSKTHGCGSMKKRRGAGNRGGRGAAGSGKRGDCKKPSISKNTKYFGKHGFKKKNKVLKLSVNLGYFEDKFDKLLKEGVLEEKSGAYNVDISKLGYDKLIGAGNLKHKFNFTAKYASSSVVDKVKKAGGNVTVLEGAETAKNETVETPEVVEE